MGTGTGAIDDSMMRDAVCCHCLTATKLRQAVSRDGKTTPYVGIPASDLPFQEDEQVLWYEFTFLQ
jgi:hypothetical protein